MSDQPPPTSMSEDQYLAMERDAPTKHEFWSGTVLEMTGASWAHAQIVGNLQVALALILHERAHVVVPGDMKVWIPGHEAYLYPDLCIVEGEPAFRGERCDIVTNPCMVIEVLSPSTERRDRTSKMEAYRSLPSLTDYLLVAQDRAHVELYARASSAKAWAHSEHGEGETVSLLNGAAALSVERIYLDVNFAHGH